MIAKKHLSVLKVYFFQNYTVISTENYINRTRTVDNFIKLFAKMSLLQDNLSQLVNSDLLKESQKQKC